MLLSRWDGLERLLGLDGIPIEESSTFCLERWPASDDIKEGGVAEEVAPIARPIPTGPSGFEFDVTPRRAFGSMASGFTLDDVGEKEKSNVLSDGFSMSNRLSSVKANIDDEIGIRKSRNTDSLDDFCIGFPACEVFRCDWSAGFSSLDDSSNP